jgi:hypothetical protein
MGYEAWIAHESLLARSPMLVSHSPTGLQDGKDRDASRNGHNLDVSCMWKFQAFDQAGPM